MDVVVPAAPLVRVPACGARRKRRWQPFAGGSCNTASCVSPSCHAACSYDSTSTGRAESQTRAILPGPRFHLARDDVEAITNMVKSIAWPANVRRVVNGRGGCLGATCDAKGARLGKNTSARESLCNKFNTALANSNHTAANSNHAAATNSNNAAAK